MTAARHMLQPRALRAVGLTQRRLAALTGMHPTTLSRYATGSLEPAPAVIAFLAAWRELDEAGRARVLASAGTA